jgi:drug/metabolite transporter (DMT)-like permease
MEQSPDNNSGPASGGSDRNILVAFIVLVAVGGSNAVAVSISNLDLPPFWAAAARFGLTALIFWVIVLARRLPLPKGRGLQGTILYGLLSVGLSYSFLYWGLLDVPPGMTMVILALVPLMTFFFALLHGLEPFRWRGLLGALVAFAGILLGVGGQLGSGVALVSVLALVAGAACIAEGSVVYKLFPPSHPVVTNALATTTGTAFLFIVSLVAGEAWSLPSTAATWASFFYLVLIGSVLLFYLYLVVLGRWTASATSYSFMLFPISTVVLSWLITGEQITTSFLFGGLLVLVGVWIGAITPAQVEDASKVEAPSP